MKGKLISVVTNCVLVVIVLAVSFVGFFGGKAVAVSNKNPNLYYRAENGSGISLMFNVYEHTENVLKILDILDEYESKSTFFIGGSWADDNVSCLKEIRDRGHEIGSHGYFHLEHDKLTLAENAEEIRRSVEFLSLAAGVTVTLFAPPSGAYGDDTIAAADGMGLKTVMWSKDTIDWRDKDEGLCYTRATKEIGGGDLVLMHPMKHTLAALPKILKYYRAHGLRAITVSENLG